jgi:dihydrofolate reductase
VTDGIEAALERAVEAAGGKDVSLGGGAETAQQYLRAGLIDELEIHVVPLILGGGSRLFENLDGGPTGYECVGLESSPAVAHFTFVRRAEPWSGRGRGRDERVVVTPDGASERLLEGGSHGVLR